MRTRRVYHKDRLTFNLSRSTIYPVFTLLKKPNGGIVMAKDSLIEKLEKLPKDRKAMLNRLRRVEGQLRGIQRMIIEEKPCYDILLQLSAARKAMQKACIEILKNYLHRCVHEAKAPDFDNLEKLIEALIEISPAKPAFPENEEESDEE
ncbi:MAG: metal-sensitive transcriptional regulator [Eubacteriales bacterium]|nr:metal-sensitive transcriptional regulator [Eubacteriales bacterium]